MTDTDKTKGFGLVKLPHFSDERGSLSIAENSDLPFVPQRFFWIYDVPKGKTRGGHAHRTCQEVVFAANGSFDIYVDNGKESNTYHVNSPSEGVYIGASVWCQLSNFSEGTICIVAASSEYEPQGYINDYDSFKEIHK